MTTITFERPWNFNAGIGPGFEWISSILGDRSRYSIETNQPNQLVIVANASSGLAGYKVVFTPVTTFASKLIGDPISGPILSFRLYDPSGALVSTVTNIPSEINDFAYVKSFEIMSLFGAEIVGSWGADTIAGYDGGSVIDGAAGDDRLTGGDGHDVIIGGLGKNTIVGGAGDDIIGGGEGPDVIDGGAGLDIVVLDNGFGPVHAFLSQPAPAWGVGVTNAEIVMLGDFGGALWGGAPEEVLIGGLGADTLDGAGGNDLIGGSDGDDVITGALGDDLLDGGRGADQLDGGVGFDTADYSLANSGLTIDLRITTAQQTGLGLDTLLNVEAIYGSDSNDTLTGDALANSLEGVGGDDRLFGGEGGDTLAGMDGRDFVRGENGNDLLTGGAAFDDLHGNWGEDTVHGGLDGDWVVGGQGNDRLFGEEDHDVLHGNLGNDYEEGGVGNDWIRGGQGDDQIHGGTGDDFIAGDRGADTISGGAGADLFHTFSGAGLDRITDFNAGEGDRVNVLAGTSYTATQSGADTVVDMGEGGQVILVGVTLAGLPAGWIFVS